MRILLFIVGMQFFRSPIYAQWLVKQEIPGVTNLSANTGLAIADFDQDGFPDIYVVAGATYEEDKAATWSRLLRNTGDGTFEDVTLQSGLLAAYDHKAEDITLPYDFECHARNGASWGDYNNDGFPDLFLTNYRYNKLFKNLGDGTFEDVTLSSGLDIDTGCYGTGATWIDYDNDSFLDLVVSAWALCNDNLLYRNLGDGTFESKHNLIARENGASWRNDPFTWMVFPLDANDDLWPDLLLVQDFGMDRLLINQSGKGFEDQTHAYQLNAIGESMGVGFSDVDGNGQLDLLMTDSQSNKLWIRNGETFVNQAKQFGVEKTGWSWQARFGDLDLDGDEDLVVANGYRTAQKNMLFINHAEEEPRFENQTDLCGFTDETSSYCLEMLDFDVDGDLDIVVTDAHGEPIFYDNRTIHLPDQEHQTWVSFDLQGTKSNRDGIGATIRIRADDVEQIRYFTGAGLMSQSLTPVHFGLGESQTVDEVEVKWPSGVIDVHTDLATDHPYRLVEGGGAEQLVIQHKKVFGCTDTYSCNYNASATASDGSCIYLSEKKISGNETSPPLVVTTYSIDSDPQHTVEWNINGGKIVDGQGTSEITVQWEISNRGKLTAREIGECASPEAELEVDIDITKGFGDAYSVARLWNEIMLSAIRGDYARPTIHARNLFHHSILMYDAWSIFNQQGRTYFEYPDEVLSMSNERSIIEKEEAIQQAISYASYRLLEARFNASPSFASLVDITHEVMNQLGYDPTYSSTNYRNHNPAAVGNYIAQQLLIYGYSDGAREPQGYNNAYYRPVNTPLAPQLPGNPICEDPNRWQQLTLQTFVDQCGNQFEGGTPDFLSAEWGNVAPFALDEEVRTINERSGESFRVYHDPSMPPQLSSLSNTASSDAYKWGFALVSAWGAHLDPSDGVMWDISPGSIGNLDLDQFPTDYSRYPAFYDLLSGGDIGQGHRINPITNRPYQTQMVPRGDYARVLAEFWADGPDSETPPGHWFTILNYVSDHPDFIRNFKGQGEIIDPLEWDVKAYFSLGGAMHDAAIAAWSIKGWYDYIRPISAIRFMAEQGQSSEPQAEDFSFEGIPLITGKIERVKSGDPLAGQQGENIGKIKLYTWRGHNYISDTETDMAGVGWILAENWWPYQRPSFVTPPFAGYVSGHSTFSRAAAEVLTHLTGSRYFPGGMGEFVARKNEFLVFEEGPSVDVKLQWATYQDASDQCSLSRIWGGIHPPADDIPGRLVGKKVGDAAFALAEEYFNARGVLHVNNKLVSEGFSAYPNPVTSDFIIISGKIKESVCLVDMLGKSYSLEYHSVSESETRIEIARGIRSGLYVLDIGESQIKLMIKRH